MPGFYFPLLEPSDKLKGTVTPKCPTDIASKFPTSKFYLGSIVKTLKMHI